MMKEWDQYWSEKQEKSGALFDRIADFYRRRIIPRLLEFFLRRNYNEGALLLHAGCGSGRVDRDVSKMFRLVSLDIAMPALKINTSSAALLQGDILKLPVRAGAFDGVYNLGVMEHFTEEEIVKILREFSRVTKPHAKVTLFWPPVFGTSEIFLKSVHFILNNILKRNIKLHPDEITRIKSKSHIKSICDKAGFKIADYYFGSKDFFTHVVLTLKKDL